MNWFYRSWACPCCGREWARRKSDRQPWFYASCNCNRKLVKAHTPRTQRECTHSRAAARVVKATIRMENRPRTRGGRLLSPPRNVKAAWREVRKAKTRPAVARRGAKFVQALLAYSRAEAASSLLLYELDGRGRVRTKPIMGGGMRGAPAVRLDETMHRSLRGEFRRSLLQGRYEIRLNPEAKCDELRATLIHEVQHLLDDDVRIKDRGHGSHWDARLKALTAIFPTGGVR